MTPEQFTAAREAIETMADPWPLEELRSGDARTLERRGAHAAGLPLNDTGRADDEEDRAQLADLAAEVLNAKQPLEPVAKVTAAEWRASRVDLFGNVLETLETAEQSDLFDAARFERRCGGCSRPLGKCRCAALGITDAPSLF